MPKIGNIMDRVVVGITGVDVGFGLGVAFCLTGVAVGLGVVTIADLLTLPDCSELD